jgi:FkbM family methyltransferase
VVNIDPLGHAYLSDFVHDAIAASAVRCQEVAAALDRTVGTLEMHVEPGGMASGSEEARLGREVTRFRASTIDQIARDLALDRIDLIKMDIEGAEPNALAGAWGAIERFRPQLAISIYHAPDHFFELPLLLASSLKNYSLFIRNYHFISNETILYAIPRERPVRARRERVSVSLM